MTGKYIPAYKWVLEHKVDDIKERLRLACKSGKAIVLPEYDTNADMENVKKL